MLAVLASAIADLGKPGEAVELLEDALASTEVSGERWWLAELHRLRGRLMPKRSSRHGAKPARYLGSNAISSDPG
jgi:predicted ATPase